MPSWTVPVSTKRTASGVFTTVHSALQKIVTDPITLLYLIILAILSLLAVIGPSIAPYGPNENLRTAGGEFKRMHPPSLEHPLGTTARAEDVFSQVVYGAQSTIFVGFAGGLVIISIGLTIALLSGYIGGRVDTVLMRITDVAYGLPTLPVALVVLSFFGGGEAVVILVISILLWRSSARVIRSQVLQIKERPFIESAQAVGASDTRIILTHILPNVAPMGALFMAIAVGAAIKVYASLAFLGFTSPYVPSWGIIIRNAYNSGYMGSAWWWAFAPGLLIAFTVLSCFMLGRRFESMSKVYSEQAEVYE